MSATVDTNVLLRAVLGDDLPQQTVATEVLAAYAHVAVPTVVLCEFTWVLARLYRKSQAEIARSIRILLAAGNIHVDRVATDAGLAMLDRGGDFADGVIACEGERLGGSTFVSFDKRAVKRVKAAGQPARLL